MQPIDPRFHANKFEERMRGLFVMELRKGKHGVAAAVSDREAALFKVVGIVLGDMKASLPKPEQSE